MKGLPQPPNPAQVPNPIELHHVKDKIPAEPQRHRQSECIKTLKGMLNLGRTLGFIGHDMMPNSVKSPLSVASVLCERKTLK